MHQSTTGGVGCAAHRPRKSEGSVMHICKGDTSTCFNPETAQMYCKWRERNTICVLLEAMGQMERQYLGKGHCLYNATYHNVYRCRLEKLDIYKKEQSKGT